MWRPVLKPQPLLTPQVQRAWLGNPALAQRGLLIVRERSGRGEHAKGRRIQQRRPVCAVGLFRTLVALGVLRTAGIDEREVIRSQSPPFLSTRRISQLSLGFEL